MRTSTRKDLESLAALIGVAALIVLGLSAVAQDEASPAAVTASTMSTGETTTVATGHVIVTPSTVVVGPVAAPAVKARRPKGF